MKNKFWKKIISMLLLPCMLAVLCGVVPVAMASTYIGRYTDGYFYFYVYDDHAEIASANARVSGTYSIPAYWNNVPVTRIRNSTFSGCSNLTSIIIPSTVQEIGSYAFEDCTALSSIVLPDAVKVLDFGTFSGCKTLSNVMLPNALTEIKSSVFSGCTALQSVALPNTLVTIGNYAFEDCTALTNIMVPQSVTSIGNSAFYGCYALKSVILSSGVASLGTDVFAACQSLQDITVSADNQNFSSRDGVLFNKDQTILIRYPVGSENTTYTVPDGVRTIGAYAFDFGMGTGALAPKLEEVTLSDSVTEIGAYAFDDMKSIKKINMSDNVQKIGDYAFGNCEKLGHITIPKAATSIGKNLFSNNKSLTSVTWNAEHVTDYKGGALFNISMKYADCAYIDLVIGDAVTSIPAYTFKGSGVRSVQFGDSLTTIGQNAFESCRIEELDIPDNVTTIGDYAFYQNSSFKNIHIGSGVKTIGYGAFDSYFLVNCAISYHGTQADWNKISIGGGNTNFTNRARTYLYDIVVGLDATGGTCDVESVAVRMDAPYGELPVPEKSGHQFLGWYTAKTGGTKVTADMALIKQENHTLYAQWYKEVYTKTTKNANGGFTIKTAGIDNGSTVVLACYLGSQMVHAEAVVKTSDADIPISPVTVAYDSVKVFAWNSTQGLSPITEAELVSF